MAIIKRARTFVAKCLSIDSEGEISERISTIETLVNEFLASKASEIIEASVEVKVVSQDGQALANTGHKGRIFIMYIVSYTTENSTL